MKKKEVSRIERELFKLQKYFGGVRGMDRRPGAIFVVDTKKERIAVHEANRLGIPVIGVVDTNSDPDGIDYIIPSNDDAIRAIKLVASRITDAVLEGSQIYQAKKEAEAQEEAKRAAEAEEEEAAEAVAEEPKKKPRRAGAKKAAPRKKTAAKPPEETPTLTAASETSASAVEEGSQ
jgi:small subunit ribosomal protein S2